MISTKCAICNNHENYKVLYEENLPKEGVNPHLYAPRRKRDYVHYRLVECNSCGLVRSNPIIEQTEMIKVYQKSECAYTDENENIPLAKTYGKYLKNILERYHVNKEYYLDIGCSNGFMLEKALELGFKNVVGVEPSEDAINKAKKSIRTKIIHDMFHGELFESDKFDLISVFQTFDHIPNPNNFLQDCLKILKKDGIIIALNHNIGSISHKILKERSPIIDIGHAYLFDLDTIRKIFQKNQFEVLRVFSVKNTVSFGRLLHLAPINEKTKTRFQKFFDKLNISSFTIPLYLGNLGIIAKKS
tara:strand:- start:259 stop:1164 length:906 start_codon:yes stop_codon:yes gene_type:complete